MRTLLILALTISALVSGNVRATGAVPVPIDTLMGTFLFSSGDTSYVRCQALLGASDSAATQALGTCVSGSPPIWKFTGATPTDTAGQGDTVWIERFHLPRRAGTIEITCAEEVWDPLTIRNSSSYAAASLFHRTLFQYDSAGQIVGDLAADWFWRGVDLVIVIDTSQRFSDGSMIDAASAKYSIERYLWYQRNVPAYSWHYSIAGVKNYLKGVGRQVVGLMPISRDTLQISLVRPHFELPALLTSARLSIVRWQVTDESAPVVATAGYYGRDGTNRAIGQGPNGGELQLSNPLELPGMLRFGTDQSGHITYISNVPVPGMLVLRARPGINRSILTFVDFALNRWVMGEVSTGREQLRPKQVYPVCSPCEMWSESKLADALRSGIWQARDTIAMDDARAARRLLRGSPRLKVAYASEWTQAANYFVDWLRAWDVKGELVSDSADWDVRIERWNYDGFSRDTWAETALFNLGLEAQDSLVQRMISARGTGDHLLRSLAYKSLLSRIEERAQYIVLFQFLGGYSYSEKESLVNVESDALGRPRGPIYTEMAKQ